MRKQLSVTLACFLLASVSASAQGWRTYEEAAQGKAYEKSDCVTLLDSTLVSVQPTGQGSFAVCKVIKVYFQFALHQSTYTMINVFY